MSSTNIRRMSSSYHLIMVDINRERMAVKMLTKRGSDKMKKMRDLLRI